MTQDHHQRPALDEDDGPAKPAWIGWLICVISVVVVVGMLIAAWRIMQYTSVPAADKAAATEPVASAPVQAAPLTPAQLARQGLEANSVCMRCHGVDHKRVGPAFAAIGQRFRDKPDAVAYLAERIQMGSVGEWGRVIMPRQSQVNDAQAQQMAQWILTLPDPAP